MSGIDTTLSKPTGLRKLVSGVFAVISLALFIASAYFIHIAHQDQRSLSIVIRPCGNDFSAV